MVDTPEEEVLLVLQTYAGLIKNVARSAVKSSSVIGEDDLFQVGCVAALNAVRAYDPSYGTNIKAYVGQAVRRAIYNEAASFLGVFTVDKRVTEIAARVNRLAAQGKKDEEIAIELTSSLKRNFDANHVRDLRLAYAGRNLASSVDDADLMDAEIRSIEALLDDIPKSEIERTILEEKILGGANAQTISSLLGISRKRVYMIERDITARIEEKIREES